MLTINPLSLQLDVSRELIWEPVGWSLASVGGALNSSSSSSSSLKYFTHPLVFLQEATEQQDWVPEPQGWDPREPTVLQASEFKRC